MWQCLFYNVYLQIINDFLLIGSNGDPIQQNFCWHKASNCIKKPTDCVKNNYNSFTYIFFILF